MELGMIVFFEGHPSAIGNNSKALTCQATATLAVFTYVKTLEKYATLLR
jgi:hypothetical protein